MLSVLWEIVSLVTRLRVQANTRTKTSRAEPHIANRITLGPISIRAAVVHKADTFCGTYALEPFSKVQNFDPEPQIRYRVTPDYLTEDSRSAKTQRRTTDIMVSPSRFQYRSIAIGVEGLAQCKKPWVSLLATLSQPRPFQDSTLELFHKSISTFLTSTSLLYTFPKNFSKSTQIPSPQATPKNRTPP